MTALTEEDIVRYILKIQLNFENAYRAETDFERALLVGSWLDALGGYPKELCDIAVNNALARAKFAPRLGDITEEIENIVSATRKTDEQLWAELAGIKYEVWDLSRYLRYPHRYDEAMARLKAIYDGLSEELKLYLVNVSSLVAFSELSEESLPYEKNKFFKNMPVLRKHAKAKISAEEFLKLTGSEGRKLLNDKND